MKVRALLNNYHIHDARRLEELFNGSKGVVDVTITSPPYWDIKDYDRRGQIGFGQSYDAYIADIEKVFSDVFRVTKRSGSLWLVADTVKHNGRVVLLPFDIARALQRCGWILQDIIIWQKDRTLPWSHQGKLRNIFEYILFFSKQRKFKYSLNRIRDISDLKAYWALYPERYSPVGRAPSRSWSFAIPRQGSWGKAANYVRHACPLPAPLVDRILELTTVKGDVVLDPFAGSGSVLAAASALGRQFVGMDLNGDYKNMFLKDVLPAVKARRHASTLSDIQKRRRKSFARTVKALRCLKYPKELTRLYRTRHGRPAWYRIWVVASGSLRAELLLFEFPDGKAPPKRFLERLELLKNVKPLSKYELDVTCKVARNTSHLKLLLSKEGLLPRTMVHVYDDGRFYQWAARARVEDVLIDTTPATRLGYPVIVSSIGVSVDPQHPETLLG